MAAWCAEARKTEESAGNGSKFRKRLFPTADAIEAASLVEWVTHSEVVRHQSMLACDLELFRLKNGDYPASLAGLPGVVLLDPLHESNFSYRKEGDFFVLYSTGPDGKDDGGVRNRSIGSTDQSDWIW